MKITISKAHWEFIGKRAGWITESQSVETQKRECPICHGRKMIEKKLKNLGTLEYDTHTITCPICHGKGYLTQEDSDAYYHSMGVAPCPYEKH